MARQCATVFFMSRKTFIWGGLFIGSSLGGFAPNFFGAGVFSMSSVIMSAVGGVLGVFIGFKLAKLFGL